MQIQDRFKFRAKRIDNNEFAYGFLCFIFRDVCRIYCSQEDKFYDCATKTLGQCTGIKDEDGKLIYDGDIVECFFDYFDGNFSEKRVVGPVVWYAASWKVKEKGNHWDLVDAGFDEKNLQADYVKIIGNIHENPELLQEK